MGPFVGLFDFEDLISRDVIQSLNCSLGPSNLYGFNDLFIAQPKVSAFIAGGHEAYASGDMIEKTSARPCGHLDLGPNSVSIIGMAYRFNHEPVVSVVCRVKQDTWLLV